MADRLNRALILLQPAPLPVDLIDNPYRTDQWLSIVNTLHQAVLVLLVDAASGALPAARAPASRDRTSVVQGKSVSVRVDLGCCRLIKKKKAKANKQVKEISNIRRN